jgi:hypothetical protein
VLIQALAVRYIAATPPVVDEVISGHEGSWEQAVDMVIDAYAERLRAAPAMRSLWLAGAMDTATVRLAAGADDLIAARLRDELTILAGVEGAGSSADWRFLVTLVGDLLRRAFRNDPLGDPEVLSRSKRVARLYVSDLL